MIRFLSVSVVFCFSITLFSQIIYPGAPTVGSVEMVFDYSVSKCNTIDIPDAPTRVFRDASGNLNLMASHYTSWRMTGANFTSLTKDCASVMTSDLDSDPSKFNNQEWISSTYTEDGTTVHALIHDEYVPCGNWNNCWYNGITYASSTNGGQTYSHTSAPSNLVAASPYQSPYPTVHTPFGVFGGSNIIKKDGYYYVLVHLEAHLLQDWGTGVIRTNNLSDPTSWRGWDGSGYNVEFVNPYTASGYNVADKVLAPVSRDRIAKMCSSLTYNTYFGKYMVVDYTNSVVNGVMTYGFFYALSDDLINWSYPRLILQTTSTWAVGGSLYPSIIDHTDVTRNFEQPGQTCYMYYTKWNSGTYDRDLLRVPLTFNIEIVNSFVVNSTTDLSDKTPGDGICLTTGGVCSLRAALEESNARPPYDFYDITPMPITFAISGTDVKTITPTIGYSEIFYPINVNGYTQTGGAENTNDFNLGLNTAIKVKVDGINTGGTFAFHCGNNTLKGLSLVNGNIDFLYEEGYSKSKDNNTIQGCFIGMSTNGVSPSDAALHFNNQDLNSIGGTTNATRNLIGGGIIFEKSDSNSVFGNYFGTTLTGVSSSGSIANGIQILDSSSYNFVGGTNAMEPNLISGGNRGVMIQGVGANGNEVVNNLIGSTIDGVTPLGNQNAGILLSNGTSSNIISGNVIMANSSDEAGIWMDSTFNNTIKSNYIGTSANQFAVAGNGNAGTYSAGIFLMNESANNMIGGVNSVDGNVIANNVFGILLESNTGFGNSFKSNIFYNNTEMAIDIDADYTPSGLDVLDVDPGPNGTQNYPIITSSYVTSSQISIVGTFNSKANTAYTIQYYSNVSCNQSGNGEGKMLIGNQIITTNSSGNATINISFSAVIPVGSFITCLATDNLNSTSEFSECLLTQAATAPSTPIISTSSGLSFCQGNSVTLTSSTATSYLWSTGATTQSIVVSIAGNYSVTVYNAQGLSASSINTSVVVNPIPLAPTTTDVSYCLNSPALSLQATAISGNHLNWYGLNSSSGIASLIAPTPNTSSSGTTKYYVSQTSNSSNCESVRAFIVVTINPLPNSPIVSNVNYCLNDNTSSLTASVLSGNTLNWYGTNQTGGTSSLISPIPTSNLTGTTTYYVSQITISSGCESSRAFITVNINSLPNVSAGIDKVICSGNTISLSGTGATSYIWDNGISDGVLFTPNVGTLTYSVTGTDVNLCTNTDQMNLTVNLTPLKPVITQIGGILHSTSTIGNQWSLSGNTIVGAISDTYSPSQDGIYTVTVTSNGCSSTSLEFNYSTTGLFDLVNQTNLIVSPNPSSGKFSILCENLDVKSMKIYNASGMIIYSQNGIISEIDLTGNSRGVYFLKLELDAQTIFRKLIIQ